METDNTIYTKFKIGDFSIFENFYKQVPNDTLNLWDWYKATLSPPSDIRNMIEYARQQPTKDSRDKYKSKLPCCTPAAVLNSRAGKLSDSEKLVEYSGLMQFDIDYIDDPANAKKKICQLPEVCFCAISFSGKGLYGFIPISQPIHLNDHFKALQLAFKNFGFELDASKGGNFTDLRIFSYDPEAYINLNAGTFTALPIAEPEQQKTTFRKHKRATKTDKPIELFNQNTYIPDLLTDFGWQIVSENKNKVILRRPGKSIGQSADYDTNKRVLFNYSDSPDAILPACEKNGHAYSPFDVYMLLNKLTFDQALKKIL